MRERSAGFVQGLSAAVLFGASIPLAKLLLGGAGRAVLAGLLYLGAGAAVGLVRRTRPVSAEAPLRRGDRLVLTAVVAIGGVVAPLLLLAGLRSIPGAAASLFLALEGPLTVALAVAFFGDSLGPRAALGIALVLAGSLALSFAGRATPGALALHGALLLSAAALAWALENNLTQRIAHRDPLRIVEVKGLAGGGFAFVLGLATGEPLPAPGIVAAALALGAASYGASVVWHIRAVRALGAARQAGLFALAPLFGALLSVVLLRDRFPWLAAFLMAPGVLLLVLERHGHRHRHEPLAHEHAHVHDEHHQHAHAGAPIEPHSHWHEHEPLDHAHPHAPDLHHRHRH